MAEDFKLDYEEESYRGLPFVPYATMLKLDGPDSDTVACVACDEKFPLSDLLGGELNEDHCPKCRNHADSYWRRFRHRAVPKQD